MKKTVELLLTENVDAIGIVGDVVKVRTGFARNFLLPRGKAIEPSEEAVQALAAKREEAEKQLREVRKQREVMIEKIADHEISLKRACNDQGQLYGSVTQKDIAEALQTDGFAVEPRDVRLSFTIKRVDSYRVHIKLDQDLDAEIKLWVVPDRELPADEREEMEFDDEGELIDPSERRPRRRRHEEAGAESGAEAEAGKPAAESA
ncbi:MAG: 50S ribosomal protein L9 [Planctomycetota bacterium]|nr:50S ribosomal protein L9 [Planctomycetota bacterium]